MSKQLKQVINLSKKTGDRVIVFDNSAPEDSFVLMTLDQYESLIGEKEDPKTEEKVEEKKEPEKELEKSDFDREIEERDAVIFETKKNEEKELKLEDNYFNPTKKENVVEGPLKETLRNLLTEKKIVDKIDSIEKNNANLNGNRGNAWRIPPEIKEDSE